MDGESPRQFKQELGTRYDVTAGRFDEPLFGFKELTIFQLDGGVALDVFHDDATGADFEREIAGILLLLVQGLGHVGIAVDRV